MSIQVTPLVYQRPDGYVPGRYRPVPVSLQKFDTQGPFLETVQTFQEVLEQYGAVDDSTFDIDPSTFVAKVEPVQHIHCGGECLAWVGLVNKDMGRNFGEFCSGVYVVKRCDGSFGVSVPG